MSRTSVVIATRVFLSVLALGFFVAFPVISEPAVRCIELSSTHFDRRLDEVASAPRNPITDAAPDTYIVRLQFDIDPAWAGDGQFVITAQRTGVVIYSGPYRPALPIVVDREMYESDDGWDNLVFQLFDSHSRRWCIWLTQPGHQFWAKPGTVRIRLMIDRWVDSDGLVNAYDVRLP